MNGKKVSLLSIAFVFTAIAMMTTPTYAYLIWNFDSDSGDYIFIEAAVGGNMYRMKLYSPSAYIFAYIEEDLPDNNDLVVYWHFWWLDENYVIHEESDTEEFSGYRYEGQSVKIEPSELPSVVLLIVAEGRAGYDGVWDTDLVIASLPLVMTP